MQHKMDPKYLDQVNDIYKTAFKEVTLSEGYNEQDIDSYITEVTDWDCWYFTFKEHHKISLLDMYIKNGIESVKDEITKNRNQQ